MSRYIDVENYCENFCRCNNEYCDKSSCPILNAPTADVAEVKYGEWVHGERISHCSECGVEMLPENITPYCPNCGARMDGGANDEM